MKKTTKVTKALTPAKKTTTKSVAKKTTAVSAVPVAPAAVVPPPTPPAPAPKPAPAPVVTTITANFDVGFGNSLHLRGEGPGLSWEKGIAMTCVSGTTWAVELGESAKPFVFKFVINDEVWSGGEDYVAPSGSSVTLTPTFPGW